MTNGSVDGIVEDYLGYLSDALVELPEVRRRQLVEQITEHIQEARSQLPEQSEAAVHNLLDRLGRPEEIAAEALTDERPPGGWRPGRKGIAAFFALVVLLAIGIGVFAFTRPATKTSQASTSTVPTTRSLKAHPTSRTVPPSQFPAPTIILTSPVNVSHNGSYTVTGGPVPASFTAQDASTAFPNATLPYFEVSVPFVAPPHLVRKGGVPYVQVTFDVIGFKTPYQGLRVSITEVQA